MIRVYTGKGKGKTTSGLGEGVLAHAQGKQVLILQFMKGSTYMGELYTLQRLGIPIIQFGVGCRWSGMIRTGIRHCNGCGECFRQNRDPEIIIPLVKQGLDFLREKSREMGSGLIILDEISHALNREFLPLADLQAVIQAGHPDLEWILTGRDMPQAFLAEAEEWWELNPLKHPFEVGIRSRRGIEY